jgi:rfaE bifunctional protein kinase chain/domain
MRHLLDWIPRFAGLRALVIGDVILDEYLIGRATRLSREAPVPVLEFEQRQLLPGGAANPAANIAALGGQALQIGVVGADSEAAQLRQVLQARRIDTGGLVVDAARPTTVKTRVMAQMGLRFPQQVARLDKLSREPISPATERGLLAAIEARLPGAQAVLLSDYHGGMLMPSLVDGVRGLAGNALLASDAQGEFDKYVGFGVVKCNADEARAYLRRDLVRDDDFEAAALQLRRALRLTVGMVITRGADGATLATADDQAAHCPAPATTEVYDTVGAGDTAVAALTLALACGAPPADAVMLANFASGIVVRHVGNYSPTPDELRAAIQVWVAG